MAGALGLQLGATESRGRGLSRGELGPRPAVCIRAGPSKGSFSPLHQARCCLPTHPEPAPSPSPSPAWTWLAGEEGASRGAWVSG